MSALMFIYPVHQAADILFCHANLVPVGRDEYPGADGQVWAEADIDEAAAAMRRIAGDRSLAERLGRAGRARIRELYDPHLVGARCLARFAAIARTAEVISPKPTDAMKMLIELNAVIKQLTPRPTTDQQVLSLESFLSGDRVVAEVSELAQDIRTPLLQARAGVKAQLRT